MSQIKTMEFITSSELNYDEIANNLLTLIFFGAFQFSLCAYFKDTTLATENMGSEEMSKEIKKMVGKLDELKKAIDKDTNDLDAAIIALELKPETQVNRNWILKKITSFFKSNSLKPTILMTQALTAE